MKRLGHIIIALASLMAATPALASTITLAPTTASVAAGQTVSVMVSVDAGQTAAVTAKAVITYPADTLEAVSFSFAPTWIQLSQPGYDSMAGGTVVKTAGYPGGFTGAKAFGTLVFKAKKAGTATIAVSGDSAVWGGQGGSSLSGAQGAFAITVTGGASSAPAAPATKKPALAPAEVVASADEPAEAEDVAAPITILPAAGDEAEEESAVGEQLAAVGAVGIGGFATAGWAWGLGILAVLGIAWFSYRRFSRAK